MSAHSNAKLTPVSRAGMVRRVVELHQPVAEVWGYHSGGTNRTLDQTVVQVRKKLGDSADSPRHLLTVHGADHRRLLPDRFFARTIPTWINLRTAA